MNSVIEVAMKARALHMRGVNFQRFEACEVRIDKDPAQIDRHVLADVPNEQFYVR